MRARKAGSEKKPPVPPYVQALVDAGAPIDIGWAWVVCAAAFLLHALLSGLARSSGIIFIEVVTEFETSKAETSVFITVIVLCTVLSSPVANILSQQISPRIVILIGSSLISAGMTLSSFMKTFPLFTLLFSGVGGVGFGFLFSPAIAMVSQYFHRRRSLAVGLSMCGGAFGAFIVPPLVTLLVRVYTFRGMLLILGAVYLNCVVSASLMRPLKFFTRHRDPSEANTLLSPTSANTDGSPEPSGKSRLAQCCHRLRNQPLLRNPRFYVTAISMAVMTEGLPFSYMLIPPLAADVGLSRTQIATIMLVMGIPDIVGRVFLGWLADRQLLRRWQLVSILAVVQVVAWVAVSFLFNFGTILAFAIVMGIAGGGIFTLFGPVMADAVGIVNINAGLGFSMLLKIIIFPVPILLGAIRDATGHWIWSYRFVGILIALSILIISFNQCIKESDPKPSIEEVDEQQVIEMDSPVGRHANT